MIGRKGTDGRRGAGKRREESRRQAQEGEMTGDVLEFVMAMDHYKRANNRPFPTWSEVFEVFRSLGYRKAAPAGGTMEPCDVRAAGVGGTEGTGE